MARAWGFLWPFRSRGGLEGIGAPEEAVNMGSVTSAPAQQPRRSSDLLEQKRAENGTRTVLFTRLGMMALFSVTVASVALASWAYSAHVARQTLERVTANEHARMLEFGSSVLDRFASGVSGIAGEIANGIRLIPGQLTGDEASQFETLQRQMCPLLPTILVLGDATMTRFMTLEGLMVGYRRVTPGSNEFVYLFANVTSPTPDASGRSDMVWYEQTVDPKTGFTTSEPQITEAIDYRASEPFRMATKKDDADWGLVWGWHKTLLFMTAQPVRDPSNGTMLGVALGAFDASELSTQLDKIRPEGGLLYAMQLEGDDEELISTSDFELLGNDTQILGTGKLDAVHASYPVMRESARFLRAHSGGKGWPSVGDVRYTKAEIAGSDYYLTTKFFVVEDAPMIVVLAVPRWTVWYQISRQTKAQFVAISLLTVAIMAGGCVLTMLLTGRVSREMLLRAELIRHLDAKRKAEQAVGL